MYSFDNPPHLPGSSDAFSLPECMIIIRRITMVRASCCGGGTDNENQSL